MKVQFKTNLMTHQKTQVKFHLQNPHSANWDEMGCGKTVIALKWAQVLKNAGLVNKILVLCPLSVLHTWELEIAKHTTFSFLSLQGSLQDKIDTLKQEVDIYGISYDSLPGRRTKRYDTYGKMLGALLNRRFEVVIADEVTMFKGYGTLRTRAVTILCDFTPYSLFLSGSPIANNPAEIFNIYRALDKGKTFGSNFFASRNKFFNNIGFAFPKWELKEEMRAELHRRMYSIAVRVRKDECLDLPPKVFSQRFCYLSKQQKSFYIPIVEELIKILDLKEGRINIKNVMSKIIKLSQITSGFMYTDRDTFYFEENPKADLVLELLKEIPNEKVIVYCYWREDVHILAKLLRESNISCGLLFGGTNASTRGKLVDEFQEGDLQVLVANIGVGGYGLNLTNSHTVIYYNLSFKALDFLQSQDRIHRKGQVKTCLYLPLMAQGTIDEYIFNSVIQKVGVAESITDGKELKEVMKRFLKNATRVEEYDATIKP